MITIYNKNKILSEKEVRICVCFLIHLLLLVTSSLCSVMYSFISYYEYKIITVTTPHIIKINILQCTWVHSCTKICTACCTVWYAVIKSFSPQITSTYTIFTLQYYGKGLALALTFLKKKIFKGLKRNIYSIKMYKIFSGDNVLVFACEDSSKCEPGL